MMDHKKGRRDSLVSFSKKRNTVMVENPNSSGDNSFEWVVIGSIERLGNYILSCYRNPKPVSHIWEVETTHHDWWHHQNRDPFMMGSRESRSAFCETPTIEIQEVSHFYFFTSTASWCIQHILHTESRLLWTAWAVEEWDEWMMDHTVLGSRNFVLSSLFISYQHSNEAAVKLVRSRTLQYPRILSYWRPLTKNPRSVPWLTYR